MQKSQDIFDHFPEGFEPRPIQNDLLKTIESHIKSGIGTIIISAPTGVGKSFVAATIAKYFGSSFVVTASKQLQDQYVADFGFLNPVKGKSNFACLQLMDHNKIDLQNTKKAIQQELTCEKGRCKIKKGADFEVCTYKPQMANLGNIATPVCHYYLQKYRALQSPHSLWNYSSYFQLMKYSRQAFSDYVDRPVGIFDEAHTIENQIIQFMGFDVYAGNISECKLDIKSYDLQDINMVLMLIEDLARSYREKIRDLESSRGFQKNPDYLILSKLESKLDRMARSYVEISTNKDNFILNDPYFDKDGSFKSLSVVPLDISKYSESFFDLPLRVFMSATIDKASFCENMGIPQDLVAYVDAPRSPFLPQNRKVEFLNIRKLSQSKSTSDDELAIIKKIDELLTRHSKERGLVLTSSENRCRQIMQNLSAQNKRRIRICHSINELGQTQSEVLKDHLNSDNSVLLSSSLWEGVDLRDDLSRFQIIAKTPYPNLGDKRTRLKMNKFPLWYKSQAITKLLQGLGRSVRSEKDWAVTYVLDSSAYDLLIRCHNMVPRAFHDVLSGGYWQK